MSADVSGRKPVTIIELDQDQCTRTFGVGGCTAALGETGDRKCMNTLKTCHVPDVFNKGTLTLRFTDARSTIPRDGTVYIPSLLSVQSRPMRIEPSKGLGTRASVKIVLQDHPSDDHQVDPYVGERPYDPMSRGTFWTKWLARNPYYQNRPVRVLHGYEGQPLNEYRTRHYFIERIQGPDATDRVTITAKDVLKLADDERAQAPRPTQVVLREDVEETDSSILLDPLFGTTVGAELPTEGYIRIGKEVMRFFGRSGGYANVQRAQFNTEAESHDAGDSVQLCLQYEGERVQDIAYDLLVNYGNVPAGFIDKAQWDAEAGVWLSGYNLSTLITEPTGVNKLLGELSEQCLFFIWWDEENQTIPWSVLRPPDDIPASVDDYEHLVAGSVGREDEPKERVSQVIVYYNQINPVEKLDEESNFSRIRVRRDVEAEGADQYGETRIRKVFSRWFDARNDGQTLSTGTRLLNAYRDNPVRVEFSLDAKDRGLFGVGDTVDMLSRYLVDDTGEPARVRLIVLSQDEVESGHRLEYECQDYRLADVRIARWMAPGSPDYSNATEEQRRTGGFWVGNDGRMSDGSEGYKFV